MANGNAVPKFFRDRSYHEVMPAQSTSHNARTAADGVEGLSRFTLLATIRRLTDAPVIMLTAKGDVMDRVPERRAARSDATTP